MSGYTPGPWRLSTFGGQELIDYTGEITIAALNDPGYLPALVADVTLRPRGPESRLEGEANAILIANAPDTAERVVELEKHLGAVIDAIGEYTVTCAITSCHADMNALRKVVEPAQDTLKAGE